MASITFLEFAGMTRLVFSEVRISRFRKLFDEVGNGGAVKVEPACNLIIRLADVFKLNNPGNLARGGVDHSIKEWQ